MRRFFLILVLILFGAIFLFPVKSFAQAACGPFYFPEIVEETLLAQLSRGIFRLAVMDGDQEKQTGTGFIVDADEGIFFTALHVVKNVFENPTLKITGTNPAFPGINFEFEIIQANNDALAQYDIGILKLKPHQVQPNLTPLELSFSIPRNFETLTSIGYTFGVEVPLPTKGFLVSSGSEILMKTETSFGDSGAPVFDKYGRVVGIVKERRSTIISIIQPIAPLWNELKRFAPRVENFMTILLSPDNQQQVQNYLNPLVRNPHITNFQLLNAFNQISQKPPSSQIASIVYCPLFFAGDHRGLGGATALLFSHLGGTRAAEIGKMYYEIGETISFTGDKTQALNFYKKSEIFLEAALSQNIFNEISLVRATACKISQGRNPPDLANELAFDFISAVGIKIIPTEDNYDSCGENTEDYFVASEIFGNLALTKLRISKLSGNEEKMLDPAFASASLGVLFSDKDLSYAGNMVVLGDVYGASGQFNHAAMAYATAWQSGEQSNWVEEKYDFSKTLATSRGEGYEGEIEFAPAFSYESFHNILPDFIATKLPENEGPS